MLERLRSSRRLRTSAQIILLTVAKSPVARLYSTNSMHFEARKPGSFQT
jgi:hypothetical protein